MKRILLIQTAFIGDVILATPVIEKLHQYYPQSKIDFLLRKGNQSLFEHHPHIHKILVWDKNQKKYWNLIRLIISLRKNEYDLVVNMHRYFTSGLITILAGAGKTIGFDKNPLSFLFTKWVKHRFEIQIHEVTRNLALIEAWTDNQFTMPKLYPSTTEAKSKIEAGQYICIAPTSVWFTKQFPLVKWAEMIDRVGDGHQVLLLGSAEDFSECEKLKSMTEHAQVRNLAGKLSLLESAMLMKGAWMNFVNDSAPMHLASAVNAPVTAIFCSTSPYFGFTPLSNVSHIVETDEKLSCKPCGLHGKRTCPKGHFKCSNIDINKLLDKLP